ncbi:hypothetical protein [Streptomyces vinaceus]|uniref:hypothetical protein n=1 Tax=Streptomyces vinaceus TaxID=1960 RepID=UPI0036CE4F4C
MSALRRDWPLGEPDGSPATVWWFSTIDDAAERRPFSQIVSHAVGEYQNIGNHCCVWLDIKQYPTAEDRKRAADQDGFLVGKSKGGPGQAWTLAPWKPTTRTQHDPVKAIAYTGLFGPVPGLLGS